MNNGPHGTARDVLDWIAYIELIEYVNSISDTAALAMVILPTFLRGHAAAERGSRLPDIPTVQPRVQAFAASAPATRAGADQRRAGRGCDA